MSRRKRNTPSTRTSMDWSTIVTGFMLITQTCISLTQIRLHLPEVIFYHQLQRKIFLTIFTSLLDTKTLHLVNIFTRHHVLHRKLNLHVFVCPCLHRPRVWKMTSNDLKNFFENFITWKRFGLCMLLTESNNWKSCKFQWKHNLSSRNGSE